MQIGGTPRQLSFEGKSFETLLSRESIRARVGELGREISLQYKDRNPMFLVVLNGAFIFAADLMRTINIDCEIQFVKLTSYQGTSSTGKVRQLIGLPQSIQGRHVLIIEDIVDTGRTLVHMMHTLQQLKPASVDVVTLLLKPNSLMHQIETEYVGFEIDDAFVVGYGLDLDGKARNLPEIYALKD